MTNKEESMQNIPQPICPLTMYFEGEEDKCDATKCDFDLDSRSCSEGCKKATDTPKVWGTNRVIHSNDLCSVNVLRIKKGGTSSLHTHRMKHNTFHVISGLLNIEAEDCSDLLSPGKNYTVWAGVKHQFQALEDTVVIEVSFVEIEESDIQRETAGYIDKNIRDKKQYICVCGNPSSRLVMGSSNTCADCGCVY